MVYAIGFEGPALPGVLPHRLGQQGGGLLSPIVRAQVTDESRELILTGVTYGVTEQSVDTANWPEVAARLKRMRAMAVGLLA